MCRLQAQSCRGCYDKHWPICKLSAVSHGSEPCRRSGGWSGFGGVCRAAAAGGSAGWGPRAARDLALPAGAPCASQISRTLNLSAHRRLAPVTNQVDPDEPCRHGRAISMSSVVPLHVGQTSRCDAEWCRRGGWAPRTTWPPS
jgi:hypothetical protein